MPATVTREMVTQYKVADSGPMPNDLYIVEVPKMIDLMRRYDHPMLKLVKPGTTHDKQEWRYGEGDLLTKQTTITEALSTTGTLVTLADSSIVQKYQKLRFPVGDEIVLVTDPDAGTNQVTVIRDWPTQSGTGASHLDNAVVQLMGPAIPEGADAVDSPVAMGEVFVTYPEIKEYTWKYSHRGRVTPNYEVKTDQFKHQLMKKQKEAACDLNRDLLSGKKYKGTGAGSPSTLGGLREATATYVDDVQGAALTMKIILTLAQTVWADVGREAMGDVLMGNMYAKRIFNSYFNKSRRTSGSDDAIKLNWDTYDTDFGRWKFVLNYDCDDNELYLWNPKDASLDRYEGGNWSTGLYSTQGWYDRGFLRYDGGPIYEASRRRMRWHTFSTTDSDYPNLDVIV